MRSCPCLSGLIDALSLGQAASAQNVIPTNSRATAPVAPSGSWGGDAVGVTISADSKLILGDEVSILIVEDKEPAWKTCVTDAGEVHANTKKGRTEMDVRLRDGDRIYVPAKGILRFGIN